MRPTAIVVVSLLAAVCSHPTSGACSKDAFEPDVDAPTGAVFVGGTSQQRNFCEDSEDWMSIPVCPGRYYSLETSALGPAADTVIEVYSQDGATLLYVEDEDEEGTPPDPAGHLAWIPNSSQGGTLHARVRQRDGTHGDLRDYQIHLTGDTSPCSTAVTSVDFVPGEFMLFNAIAQAVDGSFVSVGSLASGGGLPALTVTRWKNDGTIGWIRKLGSGTVQAATDIARTTDGGFVTVASPAGPTNSLIAKVTDGGAVSWQRIYGAGFDDNLGAIAASADGSVYAAGYLDSPATAGGFDGWLLKLNALGAPDWSMRVGSARDEFLFDTQALNEGGVVAVGTAGRVGGASDGFLLEVSAASVVVKQMVFRNTTPSSHTQLNAVRPLADGGYVVGGVDCPGGFSCRALVLKLTAEGEISWQRTLDWPGTVEEVTSIDTFQDGSIYAHVWRRGGNDEPILTRWDADGTLLWQTSLGAVNGGLHAVVSDDGGIAVGYGEGATSRLLRMDATGSVPYCALVSPASGVAGTPALIALGAGLGTGSLVEPAPAASFAITSPVRSATKTCPCSGGMGTLISVTGTASTAISWASDGFGPYDLVRGEIVTLNATGGDFTAALDAIPSNQQCLAQATSSTTVVDGYGPPLPDSGYFYLVRGRSGACPTLYDESTHQLGHRDPEITAASGPCP